jgi:thiol peroxidase
MHGKPIVLVGANAGAGERAPDFKAVDGDFAPVSLSDFKGKVVLISAVPSLDTKVCSLQTKRFNEESAKLPKDVVIVTISTDLPFAQKRFCSTEGIDRIKVLSDSVWHDFGSKYGLVIKDMGLLARSVFVVGKDGRIAYEQIVPELTNHPDYDAALKAARDACGQE